MIELIPLVIAFPVLGVLVNAFYGRREVARIVGPGVVGASFVTALAVLYGYLNTPAKEYWHDVKLWDWMPVAGLDAAFTLRVDPLSLVMTLVVTGVGFLIHVYSTGYMADDERYSRFFFYLNLFIAAMLVLVLANNYLMLFVGWEGVGLCSYLLIGFWFHKPEAADAAKKAFIVNRIGDFAFTLGVLWLFANFGTAEFEAVFKGAQARYNPDNGTMFWITLLLFIGAAGKSAQLPLYVWLPDAMEGPTPVSALIHAATMVTAGVYMVARSHPLFELAPATMAIVATVGALTAIFAATIALVNADFKRILAYSTISQLGYMFLAVGVGAFGAGIFHLTTHAFFKALMFLGAGSVMHGLRNETNIFKMGGLARYMPITAMTFVMFGAPALAGIYPWAGFFSKDEILAEAYTKGFGVLWFIGVVTAAMTAFYITRLSLLAFFGRQQFSHDVHPHESPASMTVPLILLAVLSLFGGITLSISSGETSFFNQFLAPVFESAHHGEHAVDPALEGWLIGVSLTAAAAGVVLAILMYGLRWISAAFLTRIFKPVYTLFYNKWYVDQIYHWLIVMPAIGLAELSFKVIDRAIIDNALLGGAAGLASLLARSLRWMQNGYVRAYAFLTLIGAMLMVLFFLFRL